MKTFPLSRFLIVGLIFGSGSSFAQEVIVGPPAWFDQPAVGDRLPQVRGTWRPVYPARLAAAYTGHAFVRVTVDAKGVKGSTIALRAPLPELTDSLRRELRLLELNPAVAGGKRVASSVWVPVIFNAANTNPKKPDAAPRLLAVTPLLVSRERSPVPAPPVIFATVQLDATGTMTGPPILEDASTEHLRPEVESALAQWRFSPARRAGQAVASPMRVALLTLPPWTANTGLPPSPMAKNGEVRPKRLDRPPPPPSLRGRVGFVMLAFDVETDGRVTHVVATETNDPELAEITIKDLARWKFQPGTRDGVPVKMRETIKMSFAGTTPGTTSEVYRVTGSLPDTEKLPPEVRFEVPPKPLAVVNAVYPYARLRENARGRATVLMQIDATGIVTAMRVVEETHPEFGQALMAAAALLKFHPALREGRPTATVLRQEQDFQPYAGSPLLDATDLQLLRQEKFKPEAIPGGSQLDIPLKPVARRAPRSPSALKTATGAAVVEFLVDETGRARLPRIVSATEPAFGYAAVQAVAEWRFEPPLVSGKPAVVRAQAPFNFSPSKESAATEKPE